MALGFTQTQEFVLSPNIPLSVAHIAASGGGGNYDITLINGSGDYFATDGIALSLTARLDSPTTLTATVQATDSDDTSQQVTASLTLQVILPLGFAPPAGAVEIPAAAAVSVWQVTASGGVPPYTYSLAGVNPPADKDKFTVYAASGVVSLVSNELADRTVTVTIAAADSIGGESAFVLTVAALSPPAPAHELFVLQRGNSEAKRRFYAYDGDSDLASLTLRPPQDGSYMALSFGGTLWLFGGDENRNIHAFDVRASVWTTFDETTAPMERRFPAINNATPLVHGGRMFLLGGFNITQNRFINDVWQSEDGLSWDKVQVEGDMWSRRTQAAALSYDGAIWVIGGLTVHNSQRASLTLHEVWRSDDSGRNWRVITTLTSSFYFPASYSPGPQTSANGYATRFFAAHNGEQFYVLGYSGSSNPRAATGDEAGWWAHEWRSTDGQQWNYQNLGRLEEGFSKLRPRRFASFSYYDDRLWVAGGMEDTNLVYRAGISQNGVNYDAADTEQFTAQADLADDDFVYFVAPPPPAAASRTALPLQVLFTAPNTLALIGRTPWQVAELTGSGGTESGYQFTLVGASQFFAVTGTALNLTATPGAVATLSATVQVTDSGGGTAAAQIFVRVSPPLIAGWKTPPRSVIGGGDLGVFNTITVSGGLGDPGGEIFTRFAGTAALTINRDSGEVGLADYLDAGRYTITFAVDEDGDPDNATPPAEVVLTLEVTAAVLAFVPATVTVEFAAGKLGFLLAPNRTGGAPAYQFTLLTTHPPKFAEYMTVNADNGEVTMTAATSDGVAGVTIQVTDGRGAAATLALEFNILPPVPAPDRPELYWLPRAGGGGGGYVLNPNAGSYVFNPDEEGWSAITASAPNKNYAPVVFKGKLYAIGGVAAGDDSDTPLGNQEVWRYNNNKAAWNLVNASAAFKPRHSAAVIEFNDDPDFGGSDRLYLIGGRDGENAVIAIYSSNNGVDWERLNTADKFGRNKYDGKWQLAVIEYDGFLWAYGGIGREQDADADSAGRDVWRSGDGLSWSKFETNVFPENAVYHAAVNFNDEMNVYVTGADGGVTLYRSQDGENWTVSGSPAWSPRSHYGLTEYRGTVRVAGGDRNGDESWHSTDLVTWQEAAKVEANLGESYLAAPREPATDAPAPPPPAPDDVDGDLIWLSAGFGNTLVYKRESSGGGWQQVASRPNIDTSDFAAAQFNGTVWLLGGFYSPTAILTKTVTRDDGTTYTETGRAEKVVNDVWAYDIAGDNWVEITARVDGAHFGKVEKARALVHNGSLFLMGGQNDSRLLSVVWASGDGMSWTRLASGEWPAADDIGAVSANGTLWVTDSRAGGTFVSAGENPGETTTTTVDPIRWMYWSLDGIDWNEVTFTGKRFPATDDWKPMAYFDGKLCLFALTGADNRRQWCSTNGGKTWSNESDGLPWFARTRAGVAVFGGKLYLAGGSNGGTELPSPYITDSWMLEAAPAGWSDVRETLPIFQRMDKSYLLAPAPASSSSTPQTPPPEGSDPVGFAPPAATVEILLPTAAVSVWQVTATGGSPPYTYRLAGGDPAAETGKFTVDATSGVVSLVSGELTGETVVLTITVTDSAASGAFFVLRVVPLSLTTLRFSAATPTEVVVGAGEHATITLATEEETGEVTYTAVGALPEAVGLEDGSGDNGLITTNRPLAAAETVIVTVRATDDDSPRPTTVTGVFTLRASAAAAPAEAPGFYWLQRDNRGANAWNPAGGGWGTIASRPSNAPQSEFAPVVHGTTLFAFGGGSRGGSYGEKELSYYDGDRWWRTTSGVGFSARRSASAVVHRGTIILFGGRNGPSHTNFPRNVYASTDGRNWTRISTADDQIDRRQHSPALSHAGDIWVFGGINEQNVAKRNTQRSSDGVHWTQHGAAGDDFPDGDYYAAARFNNQFHLFVSNGNRVSLYLSPDALNWSWVANTPPWSGLEYGLAVHGGTLWMAGGNVDFDGNWFSLDGTRWQQATDLPVNAEESYLAAESQLRVDVPLLEVTVTEATVPLTLATLAATEGGGGYQFALADGGNPNFRIAGGVYLVSDARAAAGETWEAIAQVTDADGDVATRAITVRFIGGEAVTAAFELALQNPRRVVANAPATVRVADVVVKLSEGNHTLTLLGGGEYFKLDDTGLSLTATFAFERLLVAVAQVSEGANTDTATLTVRVVLPLAAGWHGAPTTRIDPSETAGYSAGTITVGGGSGNYVWTRESGTTAVTVYDNGAVSITATLAEALYTVVFSVDDDEAFAATPPQTLSLILTVAGPPLLLELTETRTAVFADETPLAVANIAYSGGSGGGYTLTLLRGSGDYFTIDRGALRLTAQLTEARILTAVIRLTDSAGAGNTQFLTVQVTPPPPSEFFWLSRDPNHPNVYRLNPEQDGWTEIVNRPNSDTSGGLGYTDFAAAQFRGSLWLIGGAYGDASTIPPTYETPTRDIWAKGISGGDWAVVASLSQSWKDMRAVVHRGSLFLLGGRRGAGDLNAEVWASGNGKDWQALPTTGSPFGGAYNLAAASAGGTLWVLGGVKAGALRDSVHWSLDGKAWNAVAGGDRYVISGYKTEAAFFDGKLFLFGTLDGEPQWFSADGGRNWARQAPPPDWSLRLSLGVAVYDNKLWIAGGSATDAQDSEDSDSWVSADGRNWRQVATIRRWLNHAFLLAPASDAPAVSVCDRSAPLRQALKSAVGKTDCREIYQSDLDGVTTLSLAGQGLAALAVDDFSGLGNLRQLVLARNALTALPHGIFAGLSDLEELDLRGNDLASLPVGVFAGLQNLARLNLSGNALASLPSGIFDDLSGLRRLYLHNNALTTLPDGIFDRLNGFGALRELQLNENHFAPRLTRESAVLSGIAATVTLKLDFHFSPQVPTEVVVAEGNRARITLTTEDEIITDEFVEYFPVGEFPRAVEIANFTDDRGILRSTRPLAADEVFVVTVRADSHDNVSKVIKVTGVFTLRATARVSLGQLFWLSRHQNYPEVFSYDAEQGEWATVAARPNPQGDDNSYGYADFAAVQFRGSLWLFGGAYGQLPPGEPISFDEPAGRVLARSIDGGEWVEVGGMPQRWKNMHAVVHRGSLFLLGGRRGNQDFDSIYLSEDGSNWETITPTGETWGGAYNLAAVSADGTLWVMGGAKYPAVASQQVHWSIDGRDWTRVTGGTRYSGSTEKMAAAFFRDKLCLHGAGNSQWCSSNGRNWTAADPPPDWSARAAPGAAVYGNQLWIAGGSSTNQDGSNDADSWATTDGQNWSPVAAVNSRMLASDLLPPEKEAVFAEVDLAVPVCDRSPAVRDAITLIVGEPDCRQITSADLLSVTVLSFAGQGVAQLGGDDFTDIPNLVSLELGNNALTALPPAVFAGLTKLRWLGLSGNALENLPAGVFADLTALMTLQLAANTLTALPPTVFTALTRLRRLDLSGNAIAALPPDVFTGLTRLQWLGLSDNAMVNLPLTVFADITDIRSLRLNGNNLAALPLGVFAGLTQLEWLPLYNNALTTLSVGVFNGLSSLQRLRLDGNDFHPPLTRGAAAFVGLPLGVEIYFDLHFSTDLPGEDIVAAGEYASVQLKLENEEGDVTYAAVGILPAAVHLQDGDADSGWLRTARPLAAGEKFVVTVRAAADNGIAALTITGVFTLRAISSVCDRTAAVRNEIIRRVTGKTDCRDITIADLHEIDLLDLSRAGLSALTAGDLTGLTGLTYLKLSENPALTGLPPAVFDDLRRLTRLELNDNGLTSLPPAVFDNLASLQDLDLYRNHFQPPLTRAAAVFAALPDGAELIIDLHFSATTPAAVTAAVGRHATITLKVEEESDEQLSGVTYAVVGALPDGLGLHDGAGDMGLITTTRPLVSRQQLTVTVRASGALELAEHVISTVTGVFVVRAAPLAFASPQETVRVAAGYNGGVIYTPLVTGGLPPYQFALSSTEPAELAAHLTVAAATGELTVAAAAAAAPALATAYLQVSDSGGETAVLTLVLDIFASALPANPELFVVPHDIRADSVGYVFDPASRGWHPLNRVDGNNTPPDRTTPVVFDGYLRAFGGAFSGAASDFSYRYYSASGNWGWRLQSSSNNFTPRHSAAVLEHPPGKLVIFGGRSGNTGNNRHPYSSADGRNWRELGVAHGAALPPRWQMAAVAHRGSIWAFGGVTWDSGAATPLRDIWRSADGASWIQIGNDDALPPGSYHAAAVFNDDIHLFINDSAGNVTLYRSLDGVGWSPHGTPAWSPRSLYGLTEHRGTLWMVGGDRNGDEVWFSTDGVDWHEAAKLSRDIGGAYLVSPFRPPLRVEFKAAQTVIVADPLPAKVADLMASGGSGGGYRFELRDGSGEYFAVDATQLLLTAALTEVMTLTATLRVTDSAGANGISRLVVHALPPLRAELRGTPVGEVNPSDAAAAGGYVVGTIVTSGGSGGHTVTRIAGTPAVTLSADGALRLTMSLSAGDYAVVFAVEDDHALTPPAMVTLRFRMAASGGRLFWLDGEDNHPSSAQRSNWLILQWDSGRQSWVSVTTTPADYPIDFALGGHSAVQYNDALWLFADNKIMRYADGAWARVTTTGTKPPTPRGGAVLAHNGSLFIIGGYRQRGGGSRVGVWGSHNGERWVELRGTFDGAHGQLRAASDGVTMWLLGGANLYREPQRNVWRSTNGKNWVKVNVAEAYPAWAPRVNTSPSPAEKLGAAAYAGKLCLYSNRFSGTDAGDQYCSADRGKNWVKQRDAEWNVGYNPGVAVFNGVLYLAGGKGNQRQAWSSIDGVTWQAAGEVPAAVTNWKGTRAMLLAPEIKPPPPSLSPVLTFTETQAVFIEEALPPVSVAHLAVSGGSGGYTLTLLNGSDEYFVIDGLALNLTKALPPANILTATVRATDSAGYRGAAELVVQVVSPLRAGWQAPLSQRLYSTLAAAAINTITVSGGSGGYDYRRAAGTSAVNVADNGVVNIVRQLSPGVHTITFSVNDDETEDATAPVALALTLTVYAPLAFVPSSLTLEVLPGTALSAGQVTVTGGVPPYAYRLAGTHPPAEAAQFTVTADGVIRLTGGLIAQTVSLTVAAADSVGDEAVALVEVFAVSLGTLYFTGGTETEVVVTEGNYITINLFIFRPPGEITFEPVGALPEAVALRDGAGNQARITTTRPLAADEEFIVTIRAFHHDGSAVAIATETFTMRATAAPVPAPVFWLSNDYNYHNVFQLNSEQNGWMRVANRPNQEQSGYTDFAAAYFRSSLWLLGGAYGRDTLLFDVAVKDVWAMSADGGDWTLVGGVGSTGLPQNRKDARAVVHRGSLFVLGGRRPQGNFVYDDVLASEDGINWHTLPTTGDKWGKSYNLAATSAGGTLWVMGGVSDDGVNQREVFWSLDGKAWNRVTGGTRYYGSANKMAAVFFAGRLCLFGASAGKPQWCSANGGRNWQSITPDWKARTGPGAVVYNSRLWIAGGNPTDAENDEDGDTWVTATGQNWQLVTTVNNPMQQSYLLAPLSKAPAVSVCDRSADMRQIITELVGKTDCQEVYQADLDGLTTLDLASQGLDSLGSDDFNGMINLRQLILRDNALVTLPARVFADLINLETLRLDNNDLAGLPVGVFAGLSSLQRLDLSANAFTALPDGVFDQLAAFGVLRELRLNRNYFSPRLNRELPLLAGFAPTVTLVLDLHFSPETPTEVVVVAGKRATISLTVEDKVGAVIYQYGGPAPDNVRLNSFGDDTGALRSKRPLAAGEVVIVTIEAFAGGSGSGAAKVTGVFTMRATADIGPQLMFWLSGASGNTLIFRLNAQNNGWVEDTPRVNEGTVGLADFAAAQFKGSLWIIGGLTGKQAQLEDPRVELLETRDVWARAVDGEDWVQIGRGLPKSWMDMRAVVHRGSLFALGGRKQPGGAYSEFKTNNEVYLLGGDRAEGEHYWKTVSPTGDHWGRLYNLAAVSAEGTLWVMGGVNHLGQAQQGVFWSIDAVHWNEVTVETPYSKSLEKMEAAYFAGNLCLHGINRDSESEDPEYQWCSSDGGKNWRETNPLPGWQEPTEWEGSSVEGSGRHGVGVAEYDNMLWLAGGSSTHGQRQGDWLTADSWATADGTTWTAVAAAPRYQWQMFKSHLLAPEKPAVFAEVDLATPVCERTAAVRDAITMIVGDSDCRQITRADLAAVTHLSLAAQGLTGLSGGDFSDMANLATLDLAGNTLTALPAGIFAGLTRLEWLGLSGNGLESLPAGVFAGLSNLLTLELGDNALPALPPAVFAGLGNLRRLNLGGNALTSLPENVFAGLTQLEWIELGNNALVNLPQNIFADFDAIRSLRLHSNSLAALPPGVFAGLTSLEWLPLYDNALTTLPAGVFDELSSLRRLRLDGNALNPPLTRADDVFDNLPNGAEVYFDPHFALDIPRESAVPAGSHATVQLKLANVEGEVTYTPVGALPSALGVHDGDAVFGLITTTRPLATGEKFLATVRASGSNGAEVVTVTGVFTLRAILSVCDRTAAVRAAITTQVGETDCSAINVMDLNGVGVLDLGHAEPELTVLIAGDFAGLTGLTYLNLSNNPALTELPFAVFAGLENLTRLELNGNGLTSLPFGAFDDLTGLQDLHLFHNHFDPPLTRRDAVFAALPPAAELIIDLHFSASTPAAVTVEIGRHATLSLAVEEEAGEVTYAAVGALPAGIGIHNAAGNSALITTSNPLALRQAFTVTVQASGALARESHIISTVTGEFVLRAAELMFSPAHERLRIATGRSADAVYMPGVSGGASPYQFTLLSTAPSEFAAHLSVDSATGEVTIAAAAAASPTLATTYLRVTDSIGETAVLTLAIETFQTAFPSNRELLVFPRDSNPNSAGYVYDSASRGWYALTYIGVGNTPRDKTAPAILGNKLYAYGGADSSGARPPGNNWIHRYTPSGSHKGWRLQGTNGDFNPRHSAAVLEHPVGRLLMLGGRSGNNGVNRHPFVSTDGINWSRLDVTGDRLPWRWQMAAVSHRGSVWAFGGITWKSGAEVSLRDVWRSANGADWTQVGGDDALPSGDYHAAAVLNDEIHLFINDSAGNVTLYRSTDGINWTPSGTPSWAPRSRYGLTEHRGTLWMAGGNRNGDEVWFSTDGANWREAVKLGRDIGGAYLVSPLRAPLRLELSQTRTVIDSAAALPVKVADLAASGGSGGYQFELIDGSDANFAINGAQLLLTSASTTEEATLTATVRVTDSNGAENTGELIIQLRL